MLAFETECRRKAVELSSGQKSEAADFSGWPAETSRAMLILSSVRRFELISRSNDQTQRTVE